MPRSLSIGDELTSGQRLDTNSQWLSLRLGELGIRVLYHTTVGDDLEANVLVFRQAIERADIIIATGGLGPTADDLTRDALRLTPPAAICIATRPQKHTSAPVLTPQAGDAGTESRAGDVSDRLPRRAEPERFRTRNRFGS